MTPLDREMRALLARLELVSHGSITAYNPSGGHGSEGPATPPGEPAPPHELYRRRYEEQDTDHGRRKVIAAAGDELQRITGRYQRPQPTETPGQVLDAMLKDTEGWAPEDIERSHWRISARLIRRHRLADGRDPETGKRVTLHSAEDDEPARRAREMRDRGMSTRQIALLLGRHQTQIVRWLKTAA